MINCECKQCGKTFLVHPSRLKLGRGKYCSLECVQKSKHTGEDKKCPICGKTFYVIRSTLDIGEGIYCGRQCMAEDYKGAGNPNYAEGHINPDGYKKIYVDGVQVLEHRVIMEDHLGRPLLSNEVVHHIDGDRLNNEIDNLRVMPWSKHASLHNLERRNKEYGVVSARGSIPPLPIERGNYEMYKL